MVYKHEPVLLKEVLQYLEPQPGQNFIDCTLGGGGYAIAIAALIAPAGKIIGIDLDQLALDNLKNRMINVTPAGNNIILVHDNFKNLQNIFQSASATEDFKTIAGVVFDLGLSSGQLEDASRGFSFQVDCPLDMSFGDDGAGNKTLTTTIVNTYELEALDRIIRDYGEEKFHYAIAKSIVTNRKIKPLATTGDLVNAIETAVPARVRYGKKIHFATRTFQALRIATNGELDNIAIALPAALDILSPGGRVAVISYHSLEDRIVKNVFRQEAKECLCPPTLPICSCNHQPKIKIITKKIIVPTAEEIARNPRARSAKLRVAEKI